VKANVARSETPTVIRMDRALTGLDGIRIQLRGRSGLEEIVRDEIDAPPRGKFRVLQMRAGLVAIAPIVPFTLGELYALRCFGSAGFVLAQIDERTGNVTEAIAAAITSPRARAIFETFTEGPIRYRLEFVSKGHQRGAVRQIVELAYAIAPMILNDARNAPWAVDIHTEGGKHSVELRPRLTPDPRLWFRRQDVPAASHPPLAACMARLGAQPGDEIVWDPFCGSGLELIERSLLGGVRKVYGTDRSREAIEITKANFVAAKLESTPASFICCDFRDFAKAAGVLPNSLSLIITNPPLGMRVPIRNLHGLIGDLLAISAKMLRPGGRLVFANPVRVEPVDATLNLQSRRVVDFGGFDCRLEVYTKTKGDAATPRPSARPHSDRMR
jgi:23S rRNA G2445 N2-methylase RlmL